MIFSNRIIKPRKKKEKYIQPKAVNVCLQNGSIKQKEDDIKYKPYTLPIVSPVFENPSIIIDDTETNILFKVYIPSDKPDFVENTEKIDKKDEICDFDNFSFNITIPKFKVHLSEGCNENEIKTSMYDFSKKLYPSCIFTDPTIVQRREDKPNNLIVNLNTHRHVNTKWLESLEYIDKISSVGSSQIFYLKKISNDLTEIKILKNIQDTTFENVNHVNKNQEYIYNFAKKKQYTESIGKMLRIQLIPHDRLYEDRVEQHPICLESSHCKVIVSLTTTPVRIMKILPTINSLVTQNRDISEVIINISTRYRRFRDPINNISEIESQINNLNNKVKTRVSLHYTDDYGPISKLIGGCEYIESKGYKESILCIVDDDTRYNHNVIGALCKMKSVSDPNHIISNSGFIFNGNRYIQVDKRRCSSCDIVEGFAGICIYYSNIDQNLKKFVGYYKTIDWNKENTCTLNHFLKACFLGDDYIISYYFRMKKYNLIRIPYGLGKIFQSDYGFDEDALHKNAFFQSNLNGYQFIQTNIGVFHTFINKIKVCRDVQNVGLNHNKLFT